MRRDDLMDEDNYKLKVKENVVRAFIQFLPKGEAIEKLLFSMKDAREFSELEKTFKFIQTKLYGATIKQLEEKHNIEEIKLLLKQENVDIHELVNDYSSFINSQSSFNSEIKQLVEESNFILKKELKTINEKLDELLKRTGENPSEKDKEIIEALFKNLFDSYKNKMKELHYDEILKSVNSIKGQEGYKNLETNLQNELISYEAEILLKSDKLKESEELTQKIIQNENYTLRICDYLLYYASVRKDERLFKKIFSKYSLLNNDQKKVKFKLVLWNYLLKEYDKIYDILCTNAETLEIKDDYKNLADAYFFIGISLFDTKRYTEAQKFLNEANNKDKSVTYKYYYLLAQTFEIIDKRSAIFLLTSQDKERLQNIYTELTTKDFIEYFNRAPIKTSEEYWVQRLTVTIHLNEEMAMEDYSKVPQGIKQSSNFKGLYADILYFNNKFEDAVEILIELYNKNKDFNHISKILSSYLSMGKYKNVLEFEKRIERFDDEGVIASLIIEAYSKLNSLESTNEFAKGYLNKTKYPIYIYRSLGDNYYNTGDFEKAYSYYDLMISSIYTDNFPPRILFAKLLRSKNFIDLTLRCLQPYLPFSYEAQKMFVYDSGKLKTKTLINNLMK
ncbi:MAG: hypothetical protein A2W11_11275 [Ignavibacteria bacterium RBG_16_35_7]|nr:MAG: hypothetical protein A2W11_11275 [Ignavibacteria bacterium RBG_16_35_7]